jgi:hypothetical protein
VTKQSRKAPTSRAVQAPNPPWIDWGQPKPSHRTGTPITLSGKLQPYGLAIGLKGSRLALADAARDLNRDAGASTFRLAALLLNGLNRAARAIPGTETKRLRSTIREHAAAAFRFLEHAERTGKAGPWAAALERAVASLRKRVGVESPYPRERRLILAAFLVHRALRQEWARLGLGDPLKREPESFYRNHVKPGLAVLEESLRDLATPHGRGARQMFFEGYDPRLQYLLDRWHPSRRSRPSR